MEFGPRQISCRNLRNYLVTPLLIINAIFQVLDEADRLLTSTFASDLRQIFAELPQERQTGLFTATLTPSILSLAEAAPRPGKQKPVIYRDISS